MHAWYWREMSERGRVPPSPQDGKPSALDTFFCSDSVPSVTGWLAQEVSARVAAGKEQRASIVPLGPVLANWIRANPS